MNKIDFKQQGGFPLVQDTLNFMQQAYMDSIAAIAGMLGDKVILTGCETLGGVVQPGMVSLNGEILYTAGGAAATVFVSEAKTAAIFEDGMSKNIYFRRTLDFGIGTPSYNWADFRRISKIVDFDPVGTVKMWYGDAAKIPTGWAICDGTQGTPDMRGRFPVGADAGNPDYVKGKTGGEEKHKLANDEIPLHQHFFKNYYFCDKTDNATLSSSFLWDKVSDVLGVNYCYGSHSSDVDNDKLWYAFDKTIASMFNGSGTSFVRADQPHENRPPYLALYFIMKIKD